MCGEGVEMVECVCGDVAMRRWEGCGGLLGCCTVGYWDLTEGNNGE